MTPLPDNPKVVIWMDPHLLVQGVATNVSPDLQVTIAYTQGDYEAHAAGQPFETSVLSMQKKKTD